jgi:Flp pilus assembly protein TadG
LASVVDPHRAVGAPRSARQHGAATAELAVAMPAVMVVLAAVLSVGQAVLVKVTCVDAARAGARAAARGAGPDQVRQQALAVVPGGQGETGSEPAVSMADVGTTGTAADLVAVTVSRSVRLVGLGPAVRVSARAVAQREQPGVPEPSP